VALRHCRRRSRRRRRRQLKGVSCTGTLPAPRQSWMHQSQFLSVKAAISLFGAFVHHQMSPNIMDRYKYIPLNTERQEIRLIRLLPGRFSDEIEVEVFHAPLPDKTSHFWNLFQKRALKPPVYEALSYVWGSADHPHTIAIRGLCHPDLNTSRRETFSRQSDTPPSLNLGRQSITQGLAVTLRGFQKSRAHNIDVSSAKFSRLSVTQNLAVVLRH
jgi:hypothetical protein